MKNNTPLTKQDLYDLFNQLPTKEDFRALQNQINTMKSDINTIKHDLKSTRNEISNMEFKTGLKLDETERSLEDSIKIYIDMILAKVGRAAKYLNND